MLPAQASWLAAGNCPPCPLPKGDQILRQKRLTIKLDFRHRMISMIPKALVGAPKMAGSCGEMSPGISFRYSSRRRHSGGRGNGAHARMYACAGRHTIAYAACIHMCIYLHVACHVGLGQNVLYGVTEMFFVAMMHARACDVVVCRGAALAFEYVLITSKSYRHSTCGQ